MAFDAFLKIDGIAGESKDSKHKDEIEIESFTWGATQTGTAAVGGGHGSGKVSMHDFSFVKRMDKSSPKLMLSCADGSHLKSAVFTVRKAGGKQEDYMVIKFTDILISSFQNSGSSGGSDIPTESISFNFGKIEFEYKEQKADGTLGGVVKSGWDVKKNVKV